MPNPIRLAGLAFALSLFVFSPALADPCDDLAASPYDDTRPAGIAGVEPDEIDVEKALPACMAAHEANKDDPRIAFQLARVLEMSDEFEKAKALYEQAMNAGHIGATINYGAAVEEADPKAAFAAYTKAAEAGNVLGQYNLGVAYKDGIGTEPDGAKAIEWTTKAADQGDPWAAYNLAIIHDEGTLVPKDMDKAITFYKKAVEGGNIDAMMNLAIVYEEGQGVPADKAEALRLYQMAADAGDEEAQQAVERLKEAK